MGTHYRSPFLRVLVCSITTILGFFFGLATTAHSAEPEMAPTPLLLGVNLLDIQPASSGQPVARNASVRLRGFGVYSSASGDIQYGDETPGIRSNLDLESTLGMDLDKFTGGALLGFNLGADKRLHVDLSYEGYYNYTGSRNVGSISFNDQIFTADVSSSLRIYEGAIAFGYDIYRADGTGLTLTPTLGLRLFYVEATLGEDASPLSSSATLWVPIPELGGSLRWDLTENFYVKGSASGIYAGELASFVNLSAEAGFDVNANLGVFIGYRYWLLQFNYDDDELDFDTSGVYAGVELRM
jgi:hypothetical protein